MTIVQRPLADTRNCNVVATSAGETYNKRWVLCSVSTLPRKPLVILMDLHSFTQFFSNLVIPQKLKSMLYSCSINLGCRLIVYVLRDDYISMPLHIEVLTITKKLKNITIKFNYIDTAIYIYIYSALHQFMQKCVNILLNKLEAKHYTRMFEINILLK